jgi:dolichol-phosphate mannosyltransferase
LLSVVIPAYNEEDVLPFLVDRLRPVLTSLGAPYEIIVVDDGSTDGTPVVLAGLLRDWPQMRVVRFRRNFGHEAALTAGLLRTTGQYVISLDADLQDPPEIIPQMLAKARTEGFDVIYGVRSNRVVDSVYKRWTAGVYYRLIRRLVGKDVPAQVAHFRLMSRAVVDALGQLPDSVPVYRIAVPWLGFSSGKVSYTREKRVAGQTKYSLSKMVQTAADSVTSFSAAPLQLTTWLGVSAMALCLLLGIAVLVAYSSGNTIPGWAPIYVVVLFIGAIQLICLGLLGAYVARIHHAVQDRPAYLVEYDSASSDTTNNQSH